MQIQETEISCGVAQAWGILTDVNAATKDLQNALAEYNSSEDYPVVHVMMSNTKPGFFNHLNRKYRGSIKMSGPTVNPNSGNKIWTAIFTVPKGFVKCGTCGK